MPPPAPPLPLDGGDGGDGARRPAPGVIAGVACMLIGFAMVAVSLADPSSESPSGATRTTVVAGEAALEVPDLATGTTAPLGGAGIGEGFAPEVSGRTPLRGFGEVAATITSGTGEVCEVCLLSAVTPEQRERGLMEVTDATLGGYDGMLFEFGGEVEGAFWMRNTPLPLSIAYFDERGNLVSTEDMEPCGIEGECPTYPAAAPFSYALEVPAGQLADVGATGAARLVINARICPEADAEG